MSEGLYSKEKTPLSTAEVTAHNQDLLVGLREQMDAQKPLDELRREAQKYIERKDRKAFISLEGQVPTGFVEVNLEEELPAGAPETVQVGELAHLARIGVLDAYRGKGVATELLARAEEYARASGKRGIWLDYLAENGPAAFLYAAQGYADLAEFADGGHDRLRRIAVKYLTTA